MKRCKVWNRDAKGFVRTALAVLGLTALALTPGTIVSAESLARHGHQSRHNSHGREEALPYGCMQHGKFDVADFFRMDEVRIAQLCLDDVPLWSPRTANNPAIIAALAAKAYIWGLGPEYIERFSQYNTSIGAHFNNFKYGAVPGAWNNEATNAGDASVLYVSGFVNFGKARELVLTVPPSRDQYYIAAYMDAYANSIGSIGTRTTPSDSQTSYLLVGPNSRYANRKSVYIHGHQYPVMASDTDITG